MFEQLISKRKAHEGDRFGRWTALGERQGDGSYTWVKCRCDCGTERFVQQRMLVANKTGSCGCLRRDKARAQAEKARAARRQAVQPTDPKTGRFVAA